MEHEAGMNAIRQGLRRSGSTARLAVRGLRRNGVERSTDQAEKPLRERRIVSPLTRRILAVNLIALLIPVGGLFYVGPYRDSLIDAELESLRSQGEMIAGAIGESAIEITPAGGQFIDLEPARHILRRLSVA